MALTSGLPSAATPTALGTVYGSMTTGGGSPYITALGYNALVANTTGTRAVAVGREALLLNTTGDRNHAFGMGALASNVSGSFNTAVGYAALIANTASNNTAVGYQAALTNTTGTNILALGYRAMYLANTGSSVVAVGPFSLYNNTGTDNAAIGVEALYTNTTGTSNVSMGSGSLFGNTTGTKNIGIGVSALQANTTASNNTAVGYQALYTQTNPAGTNTAFGYRAGYGVTTGYDNIFIGENAGNATNILTTGTGNICIGTSTRTSAATSTNQINIGYGVTGQANDNVTLGSFAGKIYNAYTSNATWTQTSDARLKTNVQDDSLGLSFINRLRPVKFNWKPSNEIDQGLSYYNETNQRNTDTVIHGLIAQEVKAALDAEGVTTFAGWDEGPDGIQAISREMFISPLINAIKELKAEFDAYKASHP